MSETSRVKLVIAETYAHYKDWLREGNHNEKEYKVILAPHQLLGYHDVEIFYVGRYWQTDAYKEAKRIGLIRH